MSTWHIAEWAICVVLAAAIYFLSAGVAFAAMYRWPKVFNGLILSRIYFPLEALASRSQTFSRSYNAFLKWCYVRFTGWEKTNPRPFLPQDQVRVLLSANEIGRALALMRTFAQVRHIAIEEGGHFKHGPRVVEMIIRIDAESFFDLGKFKDAEEFHLIAYSHRPDEVWKPTWMELLAALSSEFGESAIVKCS